MIKYDQEFEFYMPVNTVRVISSQSVDLLKLFLGRLSPPSGRSVLVNLLSPVADNCPF